MAQPARARKADAPSQISLALTGAPVPLSSTVVLSGSVEFVNLPPSPIVIWTWDNGVLANVFVGETNDCVPCTLGTNGPFTFSSNVKVGDTITIQANSGPPSQRAAAGTKRVQSGVKGTIKVGSNESAKKHKK
jgi:hypothetical protein